MADDDVADVTEGTGRGVKAARERLKDVARQVEARYQKVADEMRREAGRGAATARERMDEAAAGFRGGYDRVRRDAVEWGEDLNDFVRDRPAQAVLIAAAAGFLLGLLFRSRD